MADRSATIAVVGLGYVGVPIAASFAAAGYDVVGVDPNAAPVDALNAGALPLATSEPGLEALLRSAVAAGRFAATTNQGRLGGREIANHRGGRDPFTSRPSDASAALRPYVHCP